MLCERAFPRALQLALVAALSVGLLAAPAAAQYCDNLEGKDVRATGRIDRAVEAAGVVFFRDRNTTCQFGIVLQKGDQGCKVGATIEVVGKLMKNKFMPDTYDVDRGSRPANETLACQ